MSLSCSTVFFQFPCKVLALIFCSLSFSFTLWSAGIGNTSILQILCCCFFFFFFFFLCRLLGGLVVWTRLSDSFVSQSPRGVWVSHSPGRILGCVNTTCPYGQISISCTFPVEHLALPVVSSLIFFLC